MSIGLNSRGFLVLNLGSTSLRAASYALPVSAGNKSSTARETGRISIPATQDHSSDLQHISSDLLAEAVSRLPSLSEIPHLIAHRIVHGADHSGPSQLTAQVLAELEALSELAPLHQPAALALVQASALRWPNARQLGVFDTSWHQTMPEKYRVLPIPYSLFSRGVKRYGFHGLAFQSAMRLLESAAPELADRRVVLVHLGGGSSLCAVLDGESVNTTMGMTPLSGIPMATRSGSLDPGVLLHLQRSLGMSDKEIDQLLWHESGLNGLSGETGDMRQLLTSNSDGARRAIDVYVAGVAQGIAAMAACLNGIDAVVFSGGIGTHSPEIRARVLGALGWLGLGVEPDFNQAGTLEISSPEAVARTFVVSIDEEREMIDAILPWGAQQPCDGNE